MADIRHIGCLVNITLTTMSKINDWLGVWWVPVGDPIIHIYIELWNEMPSYSSLYSFMAMLWLWIRMGLSTLLKATSMGDNKREFQIDSLLLRTHPSYESRFMLLYYIVCIKNVLTEDFHKFCFSDCKSKIITFTDIMWWYTSTVETGGY